MARPKSELTEMMYVRLDKRMKAVLEEFADEEQRDVSWVIRRMIAIMIPVRQSNSDALKEEIAPTRRRK